MTTASLAPFDRSKEEFSNQNTGNSRFIDKIERDVPATSKTNIDNRKENPILAQIVYN